MTKFMSRRNWPKNTSLLCANSLFRKMSERALLFTFASASAVFANQQPAGTLDAPKPELVLQTGPTGPAQQVAFSDDGRLLASGGYGGLAINVWETATGRQLRLLSKHGNNTASALFAGVTSVALSRDGQLLAGGFADNSATIWDLNSGEELASLQGSGSALGNRMGVRAIQFSPDGKYLLTVHGDGLKVWDLATGSKIRDSKRGAMGWCNGATFSADGMRIVSTSSGGESRVIVQKGNAASKTHLVSTDVATGNELPIGELSGELPARSQGKCVMTAGNGHILVSTATADTERVWDLSSTSAQPRVLINPIPNKVEFYPSYQALSPSGTFAAFAQHTKVYVWDLTEAVQLYAFGIEANPELPLANEVASLEFTPAGDRLVVGTYDGRIRIFHSSSGRLLRKLEAPVNVPGSVAFDPQGHRLFSGQKTAWNLDFGQGEQIMQQERGGMGLFSSDGGLFAEPSSNSSDVFVWDVAKGEVIATVSPKSEALANQIAISPDKKTVAVTYARSAAQLQQSLTATPAVAARAAPKGVLRPPAKSGKQKNLPNSTSLADLIEAARARQLALASMVHTDDIAAQVKIWDVASGSEIGTLASTISMSTTHGNLTFSPDGQSLAIATNAGIEIWEVPTRTKKGVLQPPPTTAGPGAQLFEVIGGTGRQIQSLHYSPDGRFIAAALKDSSQSMAEINKAIEERFAILTHPKNRGIHLFGQVRPAGQGQQKNGLSSSAPAAAMAYSVSGPIEVWDTTSGQRVLNLPGHPGGAGLVAFSPDGRLLASTGAEDDIKLWDLSSGKELRALVGHTGMIAGMAFDPNSGLLASASADGTTRLWEVDTGEQLATLLSLNDGRDWLVITPDGLFDGSPAAWSQILWRFRENIFDVVPVEIFFNEYYHPDLLADILAGRRPQAKQDIATKDRRQPQLRLETASSPEGPIVSPKLLVKVSVEAAPAGAQDVRLFRNGSLVRIWRGDVLAGKEQATLEATIPIVAGPNRLSAYAFNRENIKSPDAVLEVTGAESLGRQPVAHILAIGIDKYENSDYNLQFAGADAVGFSEELQQQMDKRRHFERFDVTVLRDQNATKTNILAAIDDLAQRVNPEDDLLIFIASHGTAARDHFFMIPYDLGYAGSRTQLDEQAVNSILQHSISDQDLEKSLEQVDAGRILLVIDACNSGQALVADEKRRGPMNSKGLAQLAYEKGMYILTASQSYQAAQEVSRIGHGLLTYALTVEGLQKGMADFEPRDGQIVMREWLDYATGRVPTLQLEELERARTLGRSLSFGEAVQARTVRPASNELREMQHPKLFYRRELDGTPWVVSAPQ
jgi:WD40 repeat protein